MLVVPGVIARLRTVVADDLKTRAWELVEAPALGAVVAGRRRSVQRARALAPVEAPHVPAGQRHPDHALPVDIAAPGAESRQRDVVDLGQRRIRRIGAGRQPYHRTRVRPVGTPDGAVHRTGHHRIEAGDHPLVPGGIDRLIGLDVLVALAVAVGVENQRRPALRRCRVAGGVEHLRIEPADHWTAAAGPPALPDRTSQCGGLRGRGVSTRRMDVRSLPGRRPDFPARAPRR